MTACWDSDQSVCRKPDTICLETPFRLTTGGHNTIQEGEGDKSNDWSQGSYSAQSGEILPQTSYSWGEYLTCPYFHTSLLPI